MATLDSSQSGHWPNQKPEPMSAIHATPLTMSARRASRAAGLRLRPITSGRVSDIASRLATLMTIKVVGSSCTRRFCLDQRWRAV
jgi:hypothetical protein